ncbi:LysR substrate-binding domain-containing protein, partial [Falsirhodobacter sp. alg1]|uniref:LysR substrate-binding domain-containing protein n=1 Tax=Falsirhodobacter sp. alg1 TaxID=1472418 RepID=UPI001ED9E1AF
WLRLPNGWRASTFARAAQAAGVLIRSADEYALMHGNAPNAVRLATAGAVPRDALRILPEGEVKWDATTAVLEKSGVRFNSNIATQSSHTGYALIAENLAIGLIEPFAAHPWRQNGVITRPFRPRLDHTYVVAQPDIQAVSSMVSAFIDILRETAATFDAD